MFEKFRTQPTAQNTILGWILSGIIVLFPITEWISALAHHEVVLETLDRDLREIEEMPQKTPRSFEKH